MVSDDREKQLLSRLRMSLSDPRVSDADKRSIKKSINTLLSEQKRETRAGSSGYQEEQLAAIVRGPALARGYYEATTLSLTAIGTIIVVLIVIGLGLNSIMYLAGAIDIFLWIGILIVGLLLWRYWD